MQQLNRISDASGLLDPNLIYPGDTLTIPAVEPGSEEQRNPNNGESGEEEGLPKPMRNDVFPRNGSGERSDWYISQEGDDQLRSDGWFGCGPTSLLMGLSDWGVMEPSEENRQQLLQETGTLDAGQFPGDVALISEWAQKKGLQSEFSQTSPDIEGMDRALAEGKTLVVNGSMLGRDGQSAYPHFVYISGTDENGNYILGDPAQPTVATWTKDDLYAFVTRGSNPPGYASLWR
jgi:hypothetical protein